MNNENQNIEYKESWRDEYVKWLCGFANAQGGKLYIGINDRGKVCGVENAHKLSEDIPNKVVSFLGIVAEVNVLDKDGKDYIEIDVAPSDVPISYKGKYYVRSGSTMQELNGAALQNFVLRKMGRSWDEVINDRATLKDIDREAVDYFIRKGIEAERVPEDLRKASTEEVLTSLGLIDNNGTLSDSGFSKLRVYLQYGIYRVEITAENIKTIRLVMYNWSDAQINNLFIGSDKDADYTSWDWVKLRTVPPVSGEPYYGVNEDLTKIVGTPSSDDVVFKKISSVNLLNVEDHIITGAAQASPYNPVYWSNYIAVDAETLYTLSIDGAVRSYGWVTHFYDSSKASLGSTHNNRHITPENCAFVRIELTNYSSVGSVDGTEHWQYQKGEVTAYESYYQYVNNDINTALSGKRFAVIGDSFTAGGAWFSRMCAKLGAFNKYNAAISGARWSDTAEPACAYEQAQSIVASGISMDYVLCVLGVNDFSNNIPLGAVVYSDDISSMNLSTITGGIQACVAYLRNNMPNAVIKIGYTPAGQFYNLSYPDLSSIIERMKEIALLYGIDYIETRCLGASRFISSQSDCWENGTAGGHPVGQGHNIIGDGMARLILSNM